MISKKDKKIQFSEYGEHFTRQIADADKLRDESLKRLHKIRASRHSTQQRELARLEDKFGVDDDRVIRHAVRIKREREIVDYMKVSIDKSVVEAETISDSYILKGKIRENSRAFLTGYTVQLMDNKNNVIGKPVKTDSNGDYSFIVEINDDNKEKKFNIAVLDKQGTQVH